MFQSIHAWRLNVVGNKECVWALPTGIGLKCCEDYFDTNCSKANFNGDFIGFFYIKYADMVLY